MKLFDAMIDATMAEVNKSGAKKLPVDLSRAWPDNGASEFIMQRESAFELGGGTEPSVNYTCVTTSEIMEEDEILLAGPDLSEIRGEVPFARIVILQTEDLGDDSEEQYRAIREMEFARYHVFPKGYMVRVSSMSNEEQVRVSREALRNGISFAAVGASYIKKYREVANVRHVRVIFLLQREAVAALKPYAKKADDVTKTLTHIYDNILADCGHCDMKSVCDEVDGMKEMHLSLSRKQAAKA